MHLYIMPHVQKASPAAQSPLDHRSQQLRRWQIPAVPQSPHSNPQVLPKSHWHCMSIHRDNLLVTHFHTHSILACSYKRIAIGHAHWDIKLET